VRIRGDLFLRFLGEKVNKFSAPERLHDEDRCAFFVSGADALPACLGMLVHVVVLHEAEFPVINREDLFKHLGISVKRKADVTDLAFCFFLADPVTDTKLFQLLPLNDIRHVMEEIVIQICRAKTLQFFIQILVQILAFLHQVLRKFGGQRDLIPKIVLLQDPAQRVLTSRVDISGIKIVDPEFKSTQYLAFCFFQIDASSFRGKTHAAIT